MVSEELVNEGRILWQFYKVIEIKWKMEAMEVDRMRKR